MQNLLKQEGRDSKPSATFYKTFVQSTLSYHGTETWSIPEDAIRPIESLHHYVARHLTN
jgi:hypothetical protein